MVPTGTGVACAPDRRGAGSPALPSATRKACRARLLGTHGNPPSNHAAQPLTRWCGPEARRSAGPSERGPAPRAMERTACVAVGSRRESVAWGGHTHPSPTLTLPHPPCPRSPLGFSKRVHPLPPWTRPDPSAVFTPPPVQGLLCVPLRASTVPPWTHPKSGELHSMRARRSAFVHLSVRAARAPPIAAAR